MLIKGKVVFQQGDGRKDPWVTNKTKHDYFLSLEINEIDDKKITSCASAFAVLKERIPAIKAGEKKLNSALSKPSLPPGAKDVFHITLGNFPDFRLGRNVAKGINEDAVAAAEEVGGQEFEFEIPNDAFSLVNTSEHTDKISFDGKLITHTQSVGYGRDTVINLHFPETVQKKLADISKKVFGEEFKLCNVQKKSVPYHATVAQASINPVLDKLFTNENNAEADFTASVRM